MRPSAVAAVLIEQYAHKSPIFIWGPPGVGKSDVVRQTGDTLGIEVRDIRLNLLDPVDLKGFPMPNEDRTLMSWIPPDFLPFEKNSKGLLFLDEMNSAPHSVQVAAYSLVLDRRIGNYFLPDGWHVVAAGNRESDRSGAQRMHAALANRFKHVEFECNIDDWAMWARHNDVHIDVLSFLRFRPNLLHSFDPAQRAFPSPRSWMMLNRDIENKLDADTEFELFKGTVGEGAAAEFIAFRRLIADLPTVDAILLNPEKTKVPDQPATLYALITALGEKADANTFERMMKFVERTPTEFQVVFVRDAVTNDHTVSKTKTFTKWGVANSGVLI